MGKGSFFEGDAVGLFQALTTGYFEVDIKIYQNIFKNQLSTGLILLSLTVL